MITLKSTEQANQLRGQIPELAILRMTQFEGTDGLYDPALHGVIIIVTSQDNVESDFPEVGDKGLLSKDDDWPVFDYVEHFPEGESFVFEAVTHFDNERVIAFIIPDMPWLDSRLRSIFASYFPEHLLPTLGQ